MYPAKRFVFRADSSIEIGTGHVMRCLCLAKALKKQAIESHFICRELPGNLINYIIDQGHTVHSLPHSFTQLTGPLRHSAWLGVSQEHDAKESGPIIEQLNPDWLIVDHYALDYQWQCLLSNHYNRLFVIDDLADRHHQCNLLLDQTHGRSEADYRPWVPEHCRILTGAKYALLRPEFSMLRHASLQRRKKPQLQQLLITLGGIDKDNVTGQVLNAINNSQLPHSCKIIVVMGSTAPWLETVGEQARNMPWNIKVLTGVDNMPQLMLESDLAIGAAGSTSWERCSLGLPTLMLILAENQQKIANNLDSAGAVELLQSPEEIATHPVINMEAGYSDQMATISGKAASITDGRGVERLVNYLLCEEPGQCR